MNEARYVIRKDADNRYVMVDQIVGRDTYLVYASQSPAEDACEMFNEIDDYIEGRDDWWV